MGARKNARPFFLAPIYFLAPATQAKASNMHARNFTWFKIRCSRSGRLPDVFVTFYISTKFSIYSLVLLRYMLQPIRIRITTLSCFETNIYLRVFLRTRALAYHSPIRKQKKYVSKPCWALNLPYINLEIPLNWPWPVTKTPSIYRIRQNILLKVIRWFCTAHLFLRITRWPPWKEHLK